MSEDDFELFRKEVADVSPINQAGRAAASHKQKVAVTPGQIYRRKAAQRSEESENRLPAGYVEVISPDTIVSFKRDGVQKGVFDKLQQGRYPLQAVLDLHLMSIDVAREAVYNFIKAGVRREVRTVLITHGKGARQKETQGILKSCVVRWLPMMDEVMAFHSAQHYHGGTGAVYVMLRKSEEAKVKTRIALGLR